MFLGKPDEAKADNCSGQCAVAYAGCNAYCLFLDPNAPNNPDCYNQCDVAGAACLIGCAIF